MVDCRRSLVLLVCWLISAETAATTCGEKQRIAQAFIANGYKAMAGAWPWHGAMFHRTGRSTTYACGVTILTEQFVISAAHCTIDPYEQQRIPASRIFVKVGITNLDDPRHVQQISADKIIRHEAYDAENYENDIALVKLYLEITYNSYVQPICLWHGDTSLSKIVSQVGYIAGWGLDEDNGLPKDLNEATIPIVSQKDCIDSDPGHFGKVYHGDKTFCAGYRNGTAAGPGDSGGGLFIRMGSNWFLRGIVSNGIKDPNMDQIDSSNYVVFTDAAYYLDWIREHVMLTGSVHIDTEIVVPVPPTNIPTAGVATHANLLGIDSCGKDKYPLGTPEELKRPLNQYPWLVVIEFYNTLKHTVEDVCHGVLIHPKFVLTAAHCIKNNGFSSLRSVRLNDYQLDTKEDIFEVDGKRIKTSAVQIGIRGISPHPDHNKPKFANNIALLMLRNETSMTPICLPPSGFTLPTNKLFNIIGWKKHSRQQKPMIRNVVQLADFAECRKKYAAANITLDPSGGQICSTYNHDDDAENCSHYKGSAPFQYVLNGPTEGRYYLAAISSFGHVDCRRDDFSDVFTNVVHYSSWIKDKVKKNENRIL